MAYADGNIIIGTSVDVGGINTGLYKINKSLKRLGKFATLAVGIKLLKDFGSSAADAASDLAEVQNIVDVSFTSMDEAGNVVEDMRYKIESFADTCIEQYGMSELAAKQTAGSFMAMGKSMDLTMEEASDMAVELTGLTGDFASFYNISQDYARVAMAAVYTGETETLKRYGIVLTEANLQTYAQTLGITESVKAMSARDKAILRYQYIMKATADMEGDFVRTQDTWANQVRVLQQVWNQFLITFGNGLVTVLKPALKVLNALLKKTIQWATTLWQIVSNIWGIELDSVTDSFGTAAEDADDIADSADDTTDALESQNDALKKQLGYYDELNVISQDTDSDSSSGSASELFSGLDLSDAGNNIVEQVEDALWSSIDNLYDWGKAIGDKISETLAAIDWPKVYSGAKNFGTGLAEFLNGLISTDTFKQVGHTIAGALNAAIYASLSFATEFDWDQLGQKLADGINEFFNTFDFNAFGASVNKWATGLMTTLKEAIKNIDWSEVLKGIGEFFSSLGVDGLIALTNLILLKKLLKLAFSGAIKEAVIEGIKKGLTKGAAEAAADSAASETVTTAVGTLFTSVGGTVSSKLGETKGAITKFFTETIALIKERMSVVAFNLKQGWDIKGSIDAAFGAGTGSLVAGFAGILSIVSGLVLAVKSFFDMWQEGWTPLKSILEAIGIALVTLGVIILAPIEGVGVLIAAIVAAGVYLVSQIAIWIHENWDSIKEFASNVKDKFDEIFNKASEVVSDITDSIGAGIKTAVNFVKNKFIKPVQEQLKPFVNNIKKVWEDLKILWEAYLVVLKMFVQTQFIIPIKHLLTELKNFFTQVFTAIRTTVTSIFSNLVMGLKTHFTNLANNFRNFVVTPIQNAWNNVTTWIASNFTAIVNILRTMFALVANYFNANLVTPIRNLWNNITSWISTSFRSLANTLRSLFSTVANYFSTYVVNPISTVWNWLISAMQYVFNGFISSIKAKINGVIWAFESVVNGMANIINTFISGFNKIGKVAAKLTGKKWNYISQISGVALPRLATGAVIPPNQEFMAILGDQKHGTNIETPLATMIEAFNAALDNRGGGNSEPIVLQLNGKQIAKAVWDENAKRYKQTGSNAYA